MCGHFIHTELSVQSSKLSFQERYTYKSLHLLTLQHLLIPLMPRIKAIPVESIEIRTTILMNFAGKYYILLKWYTRA